MRKKALMLALILASAGSLTSCGGKKVESTSAPHKPAGGSTSATEAHTEEETEAATEAAPTDAPTEKATEPATAAAVEGFKQDAAGAVVFNAPVKEQSDATIIEAAEAIYKVACETEWDFTVGSPYDIDTNTYIESGNYNWQYYLVTTDSINSIDDVKKDYHRIFSEGHEDHIEELYTEYKGRVYCLNGARGSDIFYEKTEITGVVSRSDEEICLTAVSYYSGSDFADKPYTETNEFSIVYEKDGSWRVDKFRLPY